MGFWNWFLGTQKFTSVVVNKDVLEAAREFAQQTSPKEFTALLRGEVKNHILEIEELIFQPFENDNRSAWMKVNLPAQSRVIGTIHSHPSSSTHPSKTDLHFWSKLGLVHFILGYPYGEDDYSAYTKYGNPLRVTVR